MRALQRTAVHHGEKPKVREVLAGILQDEGYGVELAATLAEARKLLGEYRYKIVCWRIGVLRAGMTASVEF